jgi:hypothetical protein
MVAAMGAVCVRRALSSLMALPSATRAVAWPTDLARKIQTELFVVHVFEIDSVKLPGGYIVLPQEEIGTRHPI